MTLAGMEQEINLLRNRLQTEIDTYRMAMGNDHELFVVKNQYQKVKATMRELKLLMICYENFINEEMKSFDTLKTN